MDHTLTISRGDFQRGGYRGGGHVGESQADGWTAGGGSTPRPPLKTGDLPNFDRTNEPGSAVMGPSNVLAGRKDDAKYSSTTIKVNPPSPNTSTVLGWDGEGMPETGSESNRLPTRRTSIDLGPDGTSQPQRRKLQLFPRSKPVEEANGGKNCYRSRHSEFYFESGNVVLVCESTSFRVQSDLLSKNSQVFRDMLEPALLNREHLSDGCPCVHLSDAARDFATLLRVFYASG